MTFAWNKKSVHITSLLRSTNQEQFCVFFTFLRDKLVLDETPVYFDGEKYNLDGFRYSELKKHYSFLAKRFEQYIPTVMSLMSGHIL